VTAASYLLWRRCFASYSRRWQARHSARSPRRAARKVSSLRQWRLSLGIYTDSGRRVMHIRREQPTSTRRCSRFISLEACFYTLADLWKADWGALRQPIRRAVLALHATNVPA
jgi:hypothetical protein